MPTELYKQAAEPFAEAIEIIKEEGGDALKSCYQCGLCTATCPWGMVKNFPVRKMMHQSQLGLLDFEHEDMWTCVTCRNCVQRCPRGVAIIDVMRSMRRAIVNLGVAKVPDSLRITMKNISGTGNPLGEEAEKRTSWAKDLNLKPFARGTEVLYFSCCIPAYDTKIQREARATANVLKKAGVDFGILGAKEVCCGESVRKAGDETLFKTLAQTNIGSFTEAGVKKIVTTSPHCYSTFKNEYPELGGNFEVLHFTQYLAQLIKDGKIKFTREIKKKVVYHDPCYLGRHSGIYDEPREILKSIPGVELVEMRNFRENSLCCGGGGGRIWMETPKGERLSDLRLEQALDVGANVLAVACPYCMSNFDDSVLTTNRSDSIEVRDIAELVLEATT
ncbi:MAG: (Fe-S)-binding protein [Chloroflexi bacterium]|nr:(Fe-S)-binding protein [Chloroflexota bacterium]